MDPPPAPTPAPPAATSERFLLASQRVSVWGACGTVLGALAGTSTAVVHGMDVAWYGTRVGVNAGILGCCVGGLNEALVFARGGTRDAYNTAGAGGVTGFLASVQRAPPRRALVVGVLCAGLGAGGQMAWEELMKVRDIMSDRRRAELGMSGDGMRGRGSDAAGRSSDSSRRSSVRDEEIGIGGKREGVGSEKGKLFPPMRLNTKLNKRATGCGQDSVGGSEDAEKGVVEEDNKGYLGGWLPVKRITDEEVQARKELDRESKMNEMK